jgi:hypothetical protein
MSIYYAYLNNVDSNTIITAEYWNALVGEQQATDDLLIGSMYPWAMVNSISTTAVGQYWVAKSASSSWIRYYETSGVFKNPNNSNAVEVITVSGGGITYKAHRILIPGLYAWNIGWGERWFDASNLRDDQVVGVKVKKVTQSQINTATDPDLFTVLADYRSITTSWAISSLSNRYIDANFSTSFGIGYPLRTYSGLHFFNAPPYSTEYEYIVFEFSSSIILSTPVASLYYSRMIGPNITLMKVR